MIGWSVVVGAVFSLALLPFFVLLARRVGNQRRKITTVKQGAMADISSLVQESLSVSGILLSKTFGQPVGKQHRGIAKPIVL